MPLAVISPRDLSEYFILKDKKGWREAEGYFSFPSLSGARRQFCSAGKQTINPEAKKYL
jgi:hypothetical protein